MKKDFPDLLVEINKEKPRKGAFVVKDADGTEFVSLLDMPRPFTKLKALDMDELIQKIVTALKE